ncbi:MAG TPA: septum site-determining protein MinC, partial [Gammaproteobacteria bacterium]|nr:septum site-determining protein MinC [Gammaproteobacteria bacterium]
SDLVLLGVVKSDAEVMSYGSVSAYKEVQGKVFAGISGNEKSTIFIHSFNAQLVSIAGVYKRFDVVPTKLYARSVMIDLNKGKLRFQIV